MTRPVPYPLGYPNQPVAPITTDPRYALAAKTRVAGYSEGGTDGSYTYAANESYVVREPISFSKTVTRGRWWWDTNRDSSPGTSTGLLTITNVYLGIEDPANLGQYLVPPALITLSAGTCGYGLRAYTPYIDFAALGFNIPGLGLLLTYVVQNTQATSQTTGNSQGSNCAVSATTTNPNALALSGTIFNAPAQTRMGVDYEYLDDGSLIGFFIGPSFVDSGGQASSLVGNRGQQSGWGQRWARETGNTAVMLSLSSAVSSRWQAASDPIFTKFPTVKPDFIFLSCVVGNDIIQGASLATAQASFRAVVAACKANFPGVPIHTSTELPYGPGFVSGPTAAPELIRQQYNTWLSQQGPALVSSVVDFDKPMCDPAQSIVSTVFTTGVAFTDTSDLVTLTAHGLTSNDIGSTVEFDAITGTTGLVSGVPYFVRSIVDANTITLSNTPGGALLALTTNGTSTRCVVTKVNTAPTTWKMATRNAAGDGSHPNPTFGTMAVAAILLAHFMSRVAA